MDLLHNEAFLYVLKSESEDRENAIDSNIECATKIFRFLKASGVDWSEDQLNWSKLLIYAQNWIFHSMNMASANKVVGFFNAISIDIDQFDEFGYNLLTAIADSETVPSIFYNSIPWDVYHLKTFLEFGVDPNSRTASGQNSLHCVVNAYNHNLFCLHRQKYEDFQDNEVFRGGEDLGEGSDWEDEELSFKSKERRYYKKQFGKSKRDVIEDAFFEKVKLLIEAGCDLHARDSHGYTPSALVQYYVSDEGYCHSILQTWTEALQRCGLDIKDVLATDKKDLAMTTAVDFEPTINGRLHRRNRGIQEDE